MIPAGRYLLIGRTGVGKSSLINTISQAALSCIDTSFPCTKTISKYEFETPLGFYEIWDSPGFCEDDNPETDANYFCLLRDFVDKYANNGEMQLSLIFAVRIGAKRIRSEDFEVVRYLARLLTLRPMPVHFVATGADFRDGLLLRQDLDIARTQYIVMLDAELLSITNRRICANAFHAAYAVDNIYGFWMTSWKPITVAVADPEAFASYETIIGHSKKYIWNWIQYAGHDPLDLLIQQRTDLLNSRIFNLTNQQGRKVLPDFVSTSPSVFGSKVFCLKNQTSSLAADIKSIDTQRQSISTINISSVQHVENKSITTALVFTADDEERDFREWMNALDELRDSSVELSAEERLHGGLDEFYAEEAEMERQLGAEAEAQWLDQWEVPDEPTDPEEENFELGIQQWLDEHYSTWNASHGGDFEAQCDPDYDMQEPEDDPNNYHPDEVERERYNYFECDDTDNIWKRIDY